jgi:hypothetical protein
MDVPDPDADLSGINVALAELARLVLCNSDGARASTLEVIASNVVLHADVGDTFGDNFAR